jgi:S1-C subfamily serine protease
LKVINADYQIEWIHKVGATGRRELFAVTKPFAGHKSGLNEGDVILELNNELIIRPSSLLKLDMPSSLEATIVRERQILQTTVHTFPTEKTETSRVILFCGGVIQQPYLAVRQRVSKLHSDVFVAGFISGSPFERYGISSRVFITSINGVPTPTLDVFAEEVSKIEDNKFFRLTGMTSHDIQFVKTLKRDEHYFPMIEYQRDRKERSGWSVTKPRR